MTRWVKRGAAPGWLVASESASGKVVRSRPLYPHPTTARYHGSGSVNEAANFHAFTPAPRDDHVRWLGSFRDGY